MSPAFSSRRLKTLDFTTVLVAAATMLLIGQLFLGTSIYFAMSVYLSLLAVIFTVHVLGIGSIAGLLITFLAFKYLIFSQILKMFLGQAADTNLSQPEATISVILLGTLSVCAAALLAGHTLKGKRVISIDLSPEVLAYLRNASLFIGIGLQVLSGTFGYDANGTMQYGGVNGFFNQFVDILWMAPYAEALRVLKLSNGKRSTSPILYAILGGMIFLGFYHNSKAGMALPVFAYLLAAVPYRGYITRAQATTVALMMLGGIYLAYPAVQMMRNERSESGLTLKQVTTFLSNSAENPSAFFNAWDDYKASQFLGSGSRFNDAFYYLGFSDELAMRFMTISATDVIVDAVNEDGPYGWSMVTFGLNLVLPTFLDPDKPRENIGDLITWHFGLRDWGANGNISTGIFPDAYAVAEWPGIIFIPFFVTLLFFLEVQITGTGLAGNFIGAYFVIKHFGFGEEGLVSSIIGIFRNNPVELLFILMLIALSDMLIMRRARRKAPARSIS